MKTRKKKTSPVKKRATAKPRQPKQPHVLLRVSTWLLALYLAALFCLKLYGLPLLPDEIKFVSAAKYMSSIFAAYASYDYSYGGAFWVLMYLLKHLLGSSAVSAAFLLLLVSPLLIVWRLANERERIIAVLFWLSMPMAWWHGKVISADTLNMFLLGMGIFSAWRKKPFWVFFLAGVAVGIKLSAVFVLPAIFALYCWRAWPLRRDNFLNLLATPLGFIIACPSWLLDYQGNLDILHGVTVKAVDPLYSVHAALFNSSATWDLVVSIAPLSYLYTAIGYVLLLGLAIWKRHVPLLCAAIAFSGLSCMFLLSAVITNWYWFPFFTFFFVALFMEQEKLRKTALLLPVLVIIFVCQLTTYTKYNLYLTAEEAARNRNSKELAACLSDVAKSFKQPVYVRSFESVEKRIARLSDDAVLPGEYKWQNIEDKRETMPQIKDVILVDAVFANIGLYPGMEKAPAVCDQRFALMVPAKQKEGL